MTVEVGVAERLNTETGRGAALAEVEVNHTVRSSEGIGTAEGDNMGEGVGTEEGDNMGEGVGTAEGDNMGEGVGTAEGDNMGEGVGTAEGDNMGEGVGTAEGDNMGEGVGTEEGDNMGEGVGTEEGDNMGEGVGTAEGDNMGEGVGREKGDNREGRSEGDSGDGLLVTTHSQEGIFVGGEVEVGDHGGVSAPQERGPAEATHREEGGVHPQFRDIDHQDVEKVEDFRRNGCGCSLNCSSNFSLKHYLSTWSDAQQMQRSELDMVLMGQVVAFTYCNEVPQNSTQYRHQLKKRERNKSTFYHNVLRICKKTFLFLHHVGYFRLRALRSHYMGQGLVSRTHGNSGGARSNALLLEDVKAIIAFITQYTESNGILLPGRIPGYKRGDIKLLPSSCTKRSVWSLYQSTAVSLSLRPVAYTTFCKVWRNFLANVVVCKPMSDLCATCQKNSTAIVRSFNLSEEEKSEVFVNTNY